MIHAGNPESILAISEGQEPTKLRVLTGTEQTKRRQSWAQLMARVFEKDVRQCPRCGKGPMQTIAVITQPLVIRKILESIGMPADAPRPYPARLPVQAELEFSA